MEEACGLLSQDRCGPQSYHLTTAKAWFSASTPFPMTSGGLQGSPSMFSQALAFQSPPLIRPQPFSSAPVLLSVGMLLAPAPAQSCPVLPVITALVLTQLAVSGITGHLGGEGSSIHPQVPYGYTLYKVTPPPGRLQPTEISPQSM